MSEQTEAQRLEAELSMATVLHGRLTHEAIKAQARCIELEAEVQALRGAVPAGWVDSVMEQAQVFASAWSLVGGCFDSGNAMEDAEAAKNELRAMLAAAPQPAAQPTEPAGEPVGTIVHSFFPPGPPHWSERHIEVDLTAGCDLPEGTPLFTRPAVPLTDEQIEALFKGVDSEDKGRFSIVRGFARAVEAAHGIAP
jgi:hypothetical protein